MNFKVVFEKCNIENFSKRMIAILTCLILITIQLLCLDETSAKNYTYEIPSYVRVGLTTYYAKKQLVSFNNKSISIGYDFDNFTNDITFECSKGFRVESNTSDRIISRDTYETYDEVIENINGDNDLIPVMVSQDEWKIATKPNRICDHIDMKDYEANDESIVLISGDNKELMIFSGKDYPLIKSNDSNPSIMKFNERHYRGYIQFVKEDKNITTVNYISMDEYLYSVLASEMSTAWPIEALKAQAVTARTYALKKIYAERYKYYDLVDTTSDQVYKGYTLEGEATIKAANETSGEVLIYTGSNDTYKDKLVETFYYACSGGVTEEPQNVWSSALPYFKSKEDIYEDKNKYYGWEISFDLGDLQKAMSKLGKNIGTVKDCYVERAKESGRVVKFTVVGSKGEYTVSKDSIRSFFTNYMGESLNSTNFELYSGSNPKVNEVKESKKVYVINGNGDISELDKEEMYIQTVDDVYEVEDLDIEELYTASFDGEIKTSKLEFENISQTSVNPRNISKDNYLIIGNGWGHGVGMSQYGAKNMAEKDFDYDEILSFYYTDVETIKIKDNYYKNDDKNNEYEDENDDENTDEYDDYEDDDKE